MKKITVLGAGRVGSAIAIDLAKKFDVLSIDINESNFELLNSQNVTTKKGDATDVSFLKTVVSESDIVISAVPGFLGYQTLKNLIELQKDIVDISFFAEDPFTLNELAIKNKVTAVIDAGVAPGMGNLILGHHYANMQVEDYECLVGGLPIERTWPYEYKAVFSPIDVIEEYIRPARYVQNNQLVVREALSDTELVEFEGIGTLESWNSDGLRTLIKTMNGVPNMIEKTLRYPGTVEYLKVLRESGYFSYDYVEVNGQKIRPIDLTAKLLFPLWQLKEGEEDFTVMRIIIKGTENGQKVEYRYVLFDKYDRETKTISMARTTGYTCTAVANLVLEGKFNEKGIIPPELVTQNNDNLDAIIKYQKERGVIYKITKS